MSTRSNDRMNSVRLGVDDTFWVVTNARPESTIADICFECSLRSLELQFKGGMTVEDNPAIFTDKIEAEREARGRIQDAKFHETNESEMESYRAALSSIKGAKA